MGLLDKITGKNETADPSGDVKPKAKAVKKPTKKDNVLDMVKDDGEIKSAASATLKEDTGRAHRVLSNFHLSEKSNRLSNNSRYVFRVTRTTNKLEVKKAVETVYDVHVTDVNIMNIKGKTRRSGKTVGKTSNWKKAYVTLKDGEKISGLAEGV